MPTEARHERAPSGRSAPARRRPRIPPPPVLAPLLEGGHRDRQQQPAAQHLQRLAGNAAATRLLDPATTQTRVQRDDDTSATDTSLDAGAPAGTTAPNPRAQIEAALDNRALITNIENFAPATDAERLHMLTVMVSAPLADANERATVTRLWVSFGMARLPDIGSTNYDLWYACTIAGANLPMSWLGNARGDVTTSVNEQVGASDYVAEGHYRYLITNNAIIVEVPMGFEPDDGVTVPTSTWFGYIQSTWNTFAAVNTADPTDRRLIEFRPMAGSGPSIQVSAGAGRANAGHYFLGDTRAPQTVPHEFGHLIGLEDEYERDAADYTRVTGEAAPAGDAAQAMPASLVAMLIHDGLMSEEHLLEWHSTAVSRRRQLVERALAAAGIVPDYQRAESPFTHEIAQKYIELYGHDMSHDIAEQVDGDGDNQAWREKIAGTFQYTNTSIMGDMSDHTHPVAPRHVRRFVAHVAAFRGGQWSAQPR